jgi:hypothetical protein
VPVQRRDRGGARESRIAVVALAAIAIVTALVIAAWKFGGAQENVPPGLAANDGATTAVGPSARRVNLSVRAVDGGSWMEVRSGSVTGKLLYSGTLEPGQRKTFQGRGLQLALAKPGNVAVRLNGNRVELPAGTTFAVSAHRIAPAAP